MCLNFKVISNDEKVERCTKPFAFMGVFFQFVRPMKGLFTDDYRPFACVLCLCLGANLNWVPRYLKPILFTFNYLCLKNVFVCIRCLFSFSSRWNWSCPDGCVFVSYLPWSHLHLLLLLVCLFFKASIFLPLKQGLPNEFMFQILPKISNLPF